MRRILLALVVTSGCTCLGHGLRRVERALGGGGPEEVQLSLVQRSGDHCEWVRRQLPSGKTWLLATLPPPCDGAEAAWSQDQTRGLVALGTLKPGQQPDPGTDDDLDSEAYGWTLDEVTFGDHQVQPLGAPPDGRLDDFGFAPNGRIQAATVEPLPPNSVTASYRGRTFPVPEYTDGRAALLHAWHWDGQGWTLDETRVVAVSFGGDPDGEFDWEDRLGPRTLDLEEQPDEDDPSWVNAPALTARLDAAVGRTDAIAGTWRRLSGDPPLYNFVAIDRGQTATLVRDDGRAATAVPGLAHPQQLVRLAVWQGFALAIDAHQMTLRNPDGAVIASGTEALSAFWPPPR